MSIVCFAAVVDVVGVTAVVDVVGVAAVDDVVGVATVVDTVGVAAVVDVVGVVTVQPRRVPHEKVLEPRLLLSLPLLLAFLLDVVKKFQRRTCRCRSRDAIRRTWLFNKLLKNNLCLPLGPISLNCQSIQLFPSMSLFSWGGLHNTEVVIALLTAAVPGSNHGSAKSFSHLCCLIREQ